ncbi:ribosome biogenesis GTP-binding protein YihA/YsxC [Pelagicoccus sp. SDUM812003]|uniref:ribosome biogenesis GTP-binding protein YihA/YsxC n=1 Tax=Pelagicoccus sp. SDUM812003 TaxID=3041267 RepID=UPI00280D8FEC|nr:ribosome biogenesis GTP-binding protein YihA/YsxC [Pelagicoccus sp. SDUM812003]MDQ8203404.1 ribosome biogenesis GTP-binding protein YihA/YsxC [Pelagicoccus sp. SDUM812003]
MKTIAARFLTSAKDLASCPPSKLPEVAFIGRSNVGKSSLVNTLTKQKDLAKVSKVPGKTKLINFFTMNGNWNLVDLPGYGFAKVGKGEEQSFNLAAGDYLTERPNLKLILTLVDSRFEPTEIDLAFINWLNEREKPYSLVFTKTDTLSKDAWQRNLAIYEETLEALEFPIPPMLPCSSKTAAGRGELIQYIESVLPKPKKKAKGSGVSLNWMK